MKQTGYPLGDVYYGRGRQNIDTIVRNPFPDVDPSGEELVTPFLETGDLTERVDHIHSVVEVLSLTHLDSSECNHRSVVASVSFELPDSMKTDIEAIKAWAEIAYMPLNIYVYGNDRVFVHVLGVNSWQDPDALPNLKCKPVHGMPHQVTLDPNVTLMPDGTAFPRIPTLSYNHQMCPKRVQGVECNITHAEMQALDHTFKLLNALNLKDIEFTLTCNWVSCPDCLSKILDHKDRIKSGKVVCIFAAEGDEDDLRNSRIIKERLGPISGLEEMHGPFISIPKMPGYGWDVVNIPLLAKLTEGDSKLHEFMKLCYSLLAMYDLERHPD